MDQHTGSATPEQLEALLDFLDEHRDLARGKLRSVAGRVQAKRLWDELCNTLNSMGGCTKTTQQWQNVWFDRKHLAKKAAADWRRSASATGGGPSTAPQLTQWELKVLSIMGDGFGERQTGARVPAFYEPIKSEEPTTSRATVPVSPQFSLKPEELAEPIETTQPTESASQTLTQEVSTTRRFSQQTRLPRRRRVSTIGASGSLNSRLLQTEDERRNRESEMNRELAGIRAALVDLCGIVKEYINKEKLQMQQPK